MKRQIKALLRRLHIAPDHTPNGVVKADSHDYSLKSYDDDLGNFDYEKYRSIQIAGNRNHLDNCWVLEDNVIFLSDYLKQELDNPMFGVCHGTRQGLEQRWFRKHLNCEVIGTDISDTASQFPNTIQWDFHDSNTDWEGRTDFIYSNSFDHSYDPKACLRTWMATLKPNGICILEHSNMHEPEGVTDLDPFGADLKLMPYLIAKWGGNDFFLWELIDAPFKPPGVRHMSFLIVRRRPQSLHKS